MTVVTVFADTNAARLTRHDWTAEELAEHLREPKEYPSKAHCPLVKLARFGDSRSENGSLRHDDNVIEITGIEGDYDGEEVSFADAQILLFEQSIEAHVYTSASHTPEKPRWRVLCPLSRAYPPPEHGRLVARLNGALGGILGTGIVPTFPELLRGARSRCDVSGGACARHAHRPAGRAGREGDPCAEQWHEQA